MEPVHQLLEIGCGNLRAGWRFIRYLEVGNYYGVDISPNVLEAAKETLEREGVADKSPHLRLVTDMRFTDLPARAFNFVHAHTFNKTESEERNVLREDFFYRTETLVELANKCGLKAEFMDDWEELGQRQSTIRVKPRSAG